MDVDFLAHHLIKLSQDAPINNDNKRWIIGVVGVPSSGKSVFAEKLSAAVNTVGNKEICQYIGMDGFHYTRKHLDTMEDPKLAHQKRGAHWTFDCDGLGKLLERISTNIEHDIIAPTFDHSTKDPTPNGTVIKPNHSIVIVEGLYLFLNISPWKDEVNPYFNERWYLKCDWKLAEKRIVKRHVESGIVQNEKDALYRWMDSDKPNGELLLKYLDVNAMNAVIEARSAGIEIVYINWQSTAKLKDDDTKENNKEETEKKTD